MNVASSPARAYAGAVASAAIHIRGEERWLHHWHRPRSTWCWSVRWRTFRPSCGGSSTRAAPPPAGSRVDVVVVGPPGVFVIAGGRPDEKERVRAKHLMTLLDAAHSVAELAGVRRDEVHPVLCLAGERPEDSWSRGVTVCGAVNLADALVFKRERLQPDEVDAAARAVRRTLLGSGRHRA